MARELKDKVMVITGGSAGIGAATAVAGARAGMKVVIAARRDEALERVAARVREAGGEVLTVVCDAASDADVSALAEQTVERFGGMDVMFANAGYGLFMPVEHMTDEATRRIFEVNYYGTIRCVKAAVPLMRKRGGGHVVITSSIVGRVGLPFYAQYSATKAAQDALGTGLRVELEPDGIDVSVLYPIGTKTEFFEVSAKLGDREEVLENTP
ncbi:MAG: SDR family oxidoreductase, partial [Desulfobacterales bacterium]|nr:SDR family oxidoreductase [Desulfobacterales bacterium]